MQFCIFNPRILCLPLLSKLYKNLDIIDFKKIKKNEHTLDTIYILKFNLEADIAGGLHVFSLPYPFNQHFRVSWEEGEHEIQD